MTKKIICADKYRMQLTYATKKSKNLILTKTMRDGEKSITYLKSA